MWFRTTWDYKDIVGGEHIEGDAVTDWINKWMLTFFAGEVGSQSHVKKMIYQFDNRPMHVTPRRSKSPTPRGSMAVEIGAQVKEKLLAIPELTDT